MFENEEKQLREIKSKLEDISIPSKQLGNAIQNGFLIAESELKAKRRKRRKSIWSLAVAAIFLLTFVTSVRVSPAFANAVASIPGMGKIVELIQYDKGIQAIIENDYYQPINASQTKDDLTFTIEGVILDEIGMVISYTLEGPYPVKEIGYDRIDIFHKGEKITPNSLSYGYPEERFKNRREDVLNYYFMEKQSFENQDFVLEIELHNAQGTTFRIPFTVWDEVKKGQVYTVNEEVEVENQKILIHDMTIHPLRVEVRFEFAESNTMEILHFEDMRIEDEKREVWSKVLSGPIGIETGARESAVYLQSNYFEEPKKLYLKFDKIQAIPKDETHLLVDLQKQEVLKQPSVGEFEVVKMDTDYLEIRFPTEQKDFGYFLFSESKNADGEHVDYKNQTMWQRDGYEYNSITFDKHHFNNPIKIKFFAYPNHLHEEVSIKIK